MKIIGKRRRIEKKTNYVKRMRLLESRKPRIAVRKTNKYMIIQYIESKMGQDAVKLSVSSKELIENGWPVEKEGSLKSLPAAYLTGMIFGNKLKTMKLQETNVIDTGLIRSTKGSRIYAAIKGIIDSGVSSVKLGENVVPTSERINNENTKSFFDKVKSKIGGKK